MCQPHPGVPSLVRLRDLALLHHHGRWLLLQGPALVQIQTSVGLHAAAAAGMRVEEEAASRGGRRGGSGGPTRQCLCSPTRHPGSFRCRQHHAGYVWGTGRIVRKNSSTN